MLAKLSNALLNKVQKIVDNAETQNFRMEATLRSTSDPELIIPLKFIDEFTILQNFTTEYTDNIEVKVQMILKDYMRISVKPQDIIIVIKKIFVESTTSEDILERTPVFYKYRCIVKNASDLLKKYHVSQLKQIEPTDAPYDYDSVLLEIYLQLLDAKTYLLRHKEVNFILHNTDVLGCIEYIRALFTITKSHIETPDNTTVLDHYIVTPPRSFTDVYDYLQYKYGVYEAGLEYYYHDDTLYMYRPYDTEVTSKIVVHFYNVQKGSYPGLFGYHWIDGDNIHIICNTGVETKNLTELGVENEGNSSSFIRSDTVIDGYRDVTNEKGMEIHDTNTVVCELSTKRGMVNSALINDYQKPNSNTYARASELIKNQGLLAVMGWAHSVPFLLLPGQKILYHYDGEDGKYKYRSGRLEYIDYKTTPTAHTNGRSYQCVSMVVLRLSDDEFV